jgi:hypothetical protein
MTATAVEFERFEGQCEGCGKGMTREVPESARGPMADRWRHAQFWCDDCHATQEDQRARLDSEKRIEQRRDASGVPLARRRPLVTLEHPEPAIDACWAWVHGDIPGLMLTGEVGVGKTTLAAAAVFEMTTTRRVLWAPLGTFFARLSLPFDEPGRRWAMEVVDGSDALALDDLDKARNTDYGREQVFTAIDHRIEERLPLLITSNMPVGEIGERFGAAVASRIAGYCAMVPVQGSDRRLA